MAQIIALGGGGFSMEPDNPLLDRYIIQQCGNSSPRICFLPTASAENADYIINFYTAFNRLGCRTGHLSLFRQPQKDLEKYLMQFDILYVGGGNTRSMLALWREWRLESMLKKALTSGVVLAGISAGAICWFEQGITDSVPGELGVMDCLGFLPGSCCPHYDGEKDRRPAFRGFVADGRCPPGYALDDGAAVHFIDNKLHRSISSRPDANAYRVEQVDGKAVEEALETHFLG